VTAKEALDAVPGERLRRDESRCGARRSRQHEPCEQDAERWTFCPDCLTVSGRLPEGHQSDSVSELHAKSCFRRNAFSSGDGVSIDTTTLLKRIDQVLAVQGVADSSRLYESIVEALQAAVTLAGIIYGAGTPQVGILLEAAKIGRANPEGLIHRSFHRHVWPVVQGSLRAMRADVELGLVGNIERRAAGEVIADMLGLAKEALSDGSDGARNVAAVLTAAAFEDTIRRMGATLAKVQGRPDLFDVLTALKESKVLVAAPHTTAQSYLKFRNDSLHADWARLNAAVVGSCITFTEALLLQHFS
jgi:hypothetical protein